MNLKISLVRVSKFRCRSILNVKDTQHVEHSVTVLTSCGRINTVELYM
jgi:hypothetical protein